MLCTGTRWLAEGTKSLAQESFPSAAPLPQAAPAPRAHAAAAGIWLELWRYDLEFPRSHRADQHHQAEAEEQQCSSFAAPALVRT